MAVRKRDIAVSTSGVDLDLGGCELGKRLPLLVEFLSESRYADGSPRVLPTLTLFVEPGLLKACLNDRDQSMVAFVTGSSLLGLLEALETGLEADSLDWRQSGQSTRKRRG